MNCNHKRLVKIQRAQMVKFQYAPTATATIHHPLGSCKTLYCEVSVI